MLLIWGQIIVLCFMRLVRLTPCTRTVVFSVLDLGSGMPKYAVAKGRKPGIYNTWYVIHFPYSSIACNFRYFFIFSRSTYTEHYIMYGLHIKLHLH